jgi:hypothetical protein
MASIPGSMLNMENIIRKVYDATTETLKTSGAAGPTNIVISSSDDSIAIGNVAGDLMAVHADGSIDTNIKGVTPVAGRIPVDIGGATVNITGPVTVSNEVEIKNDSGNPIPVSISSAVLPTNASTLSEQQTQTTKLTSIDSKLTSPLSVTGSTVALDSTSLAALENITVQNGAGASAVNIQDGGNSITVDGSVSVSNFPATQVVAGAVTANAGTNLNTSLLALDSTVAKDSSLSTINTSVNTLLKPASTLNAVTTIGSITNSVTVKADTPANQVNALKVDGSAVTQPVSASSLPLPAGAATSALQTTGNSSLSSMDSKTPSLGQALAAASSPVVLPAAQITALTPLSSVGVNNFPATQAVSAASLPLPTGAATSANQTTIDASINSLLKPASTLAAVTTVGTVSAITAITNALPIGTNSIGQVTANAGTNLNTSALNLETTQAAMSAKLPATLGAKTIANSLAVNIASDQTVPVSATSLPLPSGAATETTLSSLNTNITNGTQKTKIVDAAGNTFASLADGNGTFALEVAPSSTSYVFSTSNSTTAQLAAAATFTGTIETTQNQQSISILLVSDQNGTLTINQYIDAGGTRKVTPIVFSITANTQFSRSFAINGNYVNVVFTNNGGATTTTLNINTAYGTIPSASSRGNTPVSLDEINGTVFNLQNGALPVTLANSLLNSYCAVASAIIPVAAAQDIFWITGSATKTIKILNIGISATQTTFGTVPLFIIKRSTANSGGTPTTQTSVPNDSNFAAATATVISNTGSVTTGTSVGTIKTTKMKVGATTSLFGTDELRYEFDQPIVLRGATQLLAVNLGAATVTGGSYSIWIEWTEE